MDKSITGKIDIANESAAAVSSEALSYGSFSSMPFPAEVTPVNGTLTLSEWASFFYCEYVKGILFVLASTAFVLAVPLAVTRAGWVSRVFYKTIKRTIDVGGSVIGLLLTAPVWLLLPILIKLDSRGSVFYTQTRVGINRRSADRRFYQRTDGDDRRGRDRRREDYAGSQFQILKFRTMRQDAESATGPVWASKNDPRITRMGSFLRKTRIDEIPQLINVLRGEMSLVGPRPERPAFVAELSGKIDNYRDRLAVKPGVTGLAQVETGYDSTIESVAHKVRHDLDYIKNQSIWMDIKILCRTVVVVLTGRGAC